MMQLFYFISSLIFATAMALRVNERSSVLNERGVGFVLCLIGFPTSLYECKGCVIVEFCKDHLYMTHQHADPEFPWRYKWFQTTTSQ